MVLDDDSIESEGGLSYQEKSVIAYLITTAILYILYSLLVYRRYQVGDYDPAAAAQFLGRAILLLIGIQIVVQILTQIFLAIGSSVAARKEVDPSFEDERDKLISLKGTRNTFVAFGAGFILSMIALAAGMPATVTLVLIFIAMMVGDLTGELSKLVYYRRGM